MAFFYLEPVITLFPFKFTYVYREFYYSFLFFYYYYFIVINGLIFYLYIITLIPIFLTSFNSQMYDYFVIINSIPYIYITV